MALGELQPVSAQGLLLHQGLLSRRRRRTRRRRRRRRRRSPLPLLQSRPLRLQPLPEGLQRRLPVLLQQALPPALAAPGRLAVRPQLLSQRALQSQGLLRLQLQSQRLQQQLLAQPGAAALRQRRRQRPAAAAQAAAARLLLQAAQAQAALPPPLLLCRVHQAGRAPAGRPRRGPQLLQPGRMQCAVQPRRPGMQELQHRGSSCRRRALR